ATEVAENGKSVLLLDQEGEQNLGGQAWWSFGGLFLVDSPEQRMMGIKDSKELAWQDWMGTATYDRKEDYWGRKWAEHYLDFATEVAENGKSVLLLDQEGEQNLGGQAWWSFGGLFLVDSPEQRMMGIKDSKELAWQDWMGTATYDRKEDYWGRKWAEHYLDFATYEK